MNYVWAVILVLINAVWLALDLLGLPGNWLMVAGTLLVAWLRPGMFGAGTLVAVCVVAATGEALELLSGAVGARKGGAGRRGAAGALLGGFLGAIAGTFQSCSAPKLLSGNLRIFRILDLRICLVLAMMRAWSQLRQLRCKSPICKAGSISAA